MIMIKNMGIMIMIIADMMIMIMTLKNIIYYWPKDIAFEEDNHNEIIVLMINTIIGIAFWTISTCDSE